MQDFLGTSVEVGDYLFGGPSNSLLIIVDKDKSDDFAMVSNIGQQSSRRVLLINYVKISPEQLMIYFMQKGYKT
jgi:hypothetical protein